ncbi:MAG: hypothetical protein RMK67_02895 [Chloroflexota bacterium]|nr:hypothetical protein [Chloroflexota bacterium]
MPARRQEGLRAAVLACSPLEEAGLGRLLGRLGIRVDGEAPVAVAAGPCCLAAAPSPRGRVVVLLERADTWSVRRALVLGATAVVPAGDGELLRRAVRAAGWGLAVLPGGVPWQEGLRAAPVERRREREERLRRLLAEGRSLDEIASLLGVSRSWVKLRVGRLCRSMGGIRPRQLRVALMLAEGDGRAGLHAVMP